MVKLREKVTDGLSFDELVVGKIYTIDEDVFEPLLCSYNKEDNEKFLVMLKNGQVHLGQTKHYYYCSLKVVSDLEVEFE